LDLDWRESHHFGRQELHSVRAELENLRGINDSSVVLFVSALAVGGDNGAVYLLPTNADLDRPQSWLSLGEVLQSVQACKAKHKLLVLDIMRPFVAPRSGLFAADVPARTQALITKATDDDDKLLVLSACAPGQAALQSEELGRSVFGYYLEQGLRGAA